MKSKNGKKIITNIVIVMAFLLVPFIHVDAATPYNISAELYEFTQGDTGDFLYDYQDGLATKIPVNGVINPGDKIAVGITYTVGSPATAMQMQIGMNYDPTLLELYKDVDYIVTEFDNRAVANGGVFPGTGGAGTRVRWTLGDSNELPVSEGLNQINITLGDETTSQTVLTHPGGVMFFYFFTVKEDATPNAPIILTFDDENNAVSDPVGNSSAMTSTQVSYEVYGAASSDKTLATLSVMNGGTSYLLDPTFVAGGNTLSFQTVVSSNVSTVTLAATATDIGAHILPGGLGEKSLMVGNNTFPFTVTAADGSTAIYTIQIKRLSDIASLTDLSLSGITLNPTFETGIYQYEATVPYQTQNTTVTAHAISPATVKSGTGAWNFETIGENTKQIIVEAENCEPEYLGVPGNTCTTATYEMKVTRQAANTDATLNDIKVNNQSIAGFVSNTMNYTLNPVQNNVTSLTILPVLSDSNATYTVTGNTNFRLGNNTITIEVIAEDGITQKNYVLTVRRQSNDASLSSLTVISNPQGTLSPSFDSSTQTYTYTYEESVTEIRVSATATSSDVQKIEGLKDYIPGSDTKAEVIVTAEDGTIQTYTINFQRKLSTDNTLSALSVETNEMVYPLTPNFSSTEDYYTVAVPNEVASVEIKATASSVNHKRITGTGNISLEYGVNTKQVVVTAEDNSTKTYTIVITRELSNDATLTDIKVNNQSILGFTSDAFTYTLEAVSSLTFNLEVTYTKGHAKANVVVTGADALIEGQENTITLEVTSQDGMVTNTYILKVRRKSSNANLTRLTVTSDPQGTLNPTFNSSISTYTYYYDRTVTTIFVNAEAEDAISVNGTGEYRIGTDTQATIVVTPEDGDLRTYIVKFEQILDTDSSLSSLSVEKDGNTYPLTPIFTSEQNIYSVNVENTVDQIEIKAIANSPYIKTITGTGIQSLNYGTNTFQVEVTAEDESKTIYQLTITREINTDASLVALEVDGVSVPEFVASQTTYNLADVEYVKDAIEIRATGTTGATVTGVGTKVLSVGDNTFKITVTAQDGVTKTIYTVHIHRKSNDARLSGLTATSDPLGTLSPNFDRDIDAYTLTIPAEVTSLTIHAIPVAGATIINASDLVNIDVVTTNTIEVKVQAEDTIYTKTYTIQVEREASNNAYLSSLTVNEGILNPIFRKEVTHYTVTVDSSISTIELEAIPEDIRSSVSGDTGIQSLNYGENTLTITVTAEDHTTRDYTIVVTREKKQDASLSDLTVDHVMVEGFLPDELSYEITVPYTKESVVIGAVAADLDAVINPDGIGNKQLNVGQNIFSVIVTAQDGTSRTYLLKVTREANSDNTISNLTVFGRQPNWNEDRNCYEISVENEVSKVGPENIDAIVPEGATLDKGITMNLNGGENNYFIKVISQSGEEAIYKIVITRAKSNDNTLESLISSVGTISPALNSDPSITYTLTLPKETTEFTITAIANDPLAGVTGDGTYTLPVNNNQVLVTVTPEEGEIRIYTIQVVIEKSDNNFLATLDVTGHNLNETFQKEVLDYTVTVGHAITSVIVTATKEETNAILKMGKADTTLIETGTFTMNDLVVGENIVKVEVTSETGIQKTYTVTITREAEPVLETITSSIYQVMAEYISGISSETSLSVFKDSIDNPNEQLVVYENDGTTVFEGDYVGTGMIVKLEINGEVKDQKTIVVLGDTTGDGIIDLLDAVKITNHYIGKTLLEGPYYIAGNVISEDDIDLLDAVKVTNHYIGKTMIG